MACEVCEGSGEYPVINRNGRHLYSIRCPECYGTGESDDDEAQEKADADWNKRQLARYHAHMEQQRADNG